MKTLVLLLACLAAANALSYARPPCGYRTWSIKRFCVYPTQYFKFQVHYCGAWYTPRFYAPIMKVYPGDNCEEVSEEAFRTDCYNKLNARFLVLCSEIKSRWLPWKISLFSQVDAAKQKYKEAITAYTDAFLRYVWSYTARQEYIRRRDEAIANYNASIDKMANAACESYDTAMIERINALAAFHRKMLDTAVKCYQTRALKIAEFSDQLQKRIYKYVNNFKTTMSKIIEKRGDAYKALLFKVHCSQTWKLPMVNELVNSYKSAQYTACYADASTFYSKLMDVKTKLLNVYKCAYKCATYSGVITFAKKDYQTYCRKLGTWWTCKIDRTIRCFKYIDYKYQWKKTEYHCLQTCDVDAVNQSSEDFKADMEAKGAAAVAAARSVFAAWKAKWVDIHRQYYEKYVEIINQRHEFLVSYMKAQYYCRYYTLCGWHYAQLAAYEKELEARRDAAIKKYQDILCKRIISACNTFHTRVAQYQKMVDETVAKVVAAYDACLSTRNAKIEEYRKKVIAMRDARREKLMTAWRKVYESKCEQYNKMMLFYHPGEFSGTQFDLWLAYKGKIYLEFCNYYIGYDNLWEKLVPQLVEHYACSYKCAANAKFAVPALSCKFYNWKVCFPTITSYTYQYRCYIQYRNYRLVRTTTGYSYCR